MQENLHAILLNLKYQYVNARDLPKTSQFYTPSRKTGYYVKEFLTSWGSFEVALSIAKDPHTELPSAYILTIPSACEGRLIPHISQEQGLCYVEQMEADWDPNNLSLLYNDVDRQIQITLDNAVSAADSGDPSTEEIEGELGAYWQAKYSLFTLEKPKNNQALVTKVLEKKIGNGHLVREYATLYQHDTQTSKPQTETDQSRRWSMMRGFVPDHNTPTVTTHYVLVRPTVLAGVKWPPNNLKTLLDWLGRVDINARDRVVNFLYRANVTQHVVILEVQHQGKIAFYVEIGIPADGARRKRRPNQKKTSMKNKLAILKGYFASSKFTRLWVIGADRDTILSRNSTRSQEATLYNKRVALIGCGTVGGYLAPLLLRAGAGTDQYLHLYDDDLYIPHNFARHPLPGHDFGRYKATALADRLIESTHVETLVKAFRTQFEVTRCNLSKYDIVIDATGRPPLSKRLARVLRTMNPDTRPVLVHAFNDGNGRAAKVFIDDGSSCYGCLVSDPSMYQKGIDTRFKDIDQASERGFSCGSFFTPYHAAVSHITAGLAQQAVLSSLEPKRCWNYREHLLDDRQCSQRSRKPRLIKAHEKCAICHEIK